MPLPPLPPTPVSLHADLVSGLASRTLIAATPTGLPTDLEGLMARHGAHSGVVMVSTRVSRALITQLRRSAAVPVVAWDPGHYQHISASADRPMILDDDEPSLFAETSLTEFVAGAERDLTAIFSPTGAIGADDGAALHAAVDVCNAVAPGRLLCTLPIAKEWLTAGRRAELAGAISDAVHPVALAVTDHFDPFGDLEILEGLEELLSAVGSQVVLHRTDVIGVHALGHGALGSVIAGTASLRHTVPAGRLPRRRKKGTVPGLGIFVPGIDAFVDLGTLDGWFVDHPPLCTVGSCSPHSLTDFSHHDRPAASRHNCGGVLEIAERLLTENPGDTRAWLQDYWRAVADAYVYLRMETGRRDIWPYGAARHLTAR
ncbi:hypothetical protein GCM10009624_23450 [Gordonia sinesedis]